MQMEKSDYLYDGVYQSLKRRIISGFYKNGSPLPSRADMCEEYQVSGITVRKVLEMLATEGLIQTEQRKVPTVCYVCPAAPAPSQEEVDRICPIVVDILKTGQLIIPPILRYGLSLCTEEEIQQMIKSVSPSANPPVSPSEYWDAGYLFWKKVVLKIQNPVLVDLLEDVFLFYFPLFPMVAESYMRCQDDFEQALQRIEPFSIPAFCDCHKGCEKNGEVYSTMVELSSLSCFFMDVQQMENHMDKKGFDSVQVCIDLLRKIATGEVKKGSYLPTQQELCKKYGVSLKTITLAQGRLQRCGAVVGHRRLGTKVLISAEKAPVLAMKIEGFSQFVDHFLCKMQVELLTVKALATEVARNATQDEKLILYDTVLHVSRIKKDSIFDLFYYFLLERIQYHPLKAFYIVLYKNYFDVEWIPTLFTKTEQEIETLRDYTLRCAQDLCFGESESFGQSAQDWLQYTYDIMMRNAQDLRPPAGAGPKG